MTRGRVADAVLPRDRRHDAAAALRLVTSELVHVRADAGDFWLAEIGHHVYVGDTALHVAARPTKPGWPGP